MQLNQETGLANLNIGRRSAGEQSQATNYKKGKASLTFCTHSQHGYMNWEEAFQWVLCTGVLTWLYLCQYTVTENSLGFPHGAKWKNTGTYYLKQINKQT